MKVSLVVLSAGKSAGQAIPVTLAQFIIGRDPQCNLRPASPVISKRHCAILIKNGKVSVRDFESTNGTWVNETQVKGEFPLNHDDTLKIGPLSFRVAIEKTTPVNKPTPPPTKAPARPGNEEDVAAMLLSLQEQEAPEADPTTSADDSNVPGGSTIMDMVPLPPDTGTDMPKATAPTAPATAKPNAAPTAPAPSTAPPKPVAKASPTPAPATTPAPAPAAAPPPPEPQPAPAASRTPEKPPEKPAAKPAENKPNAQYGNARDAARAILEKFAKRRRS